MEAIAITVVLLLPSIATSTSAKQRASQTSFVMAPGHMDRNMAMSAMTTGAGTPTSASTC
jgi:hypothetical protein